MDPYLSVGAKGGDGVCEYSIAGQSYRFSELFGLNYGEHLAGDAWFAGGGGGGGLETGNSIEGGKGGGGDGGRRNIDPYGFDAMPNTGGGGGGSGNSSSGGKGGSGIVIVRYPLCTYTISGRVANSATGAGVDGVTLAFGEDYTAVTTNGGYYSVSVPEGWSGTVALSFKHEGVFSPLGRTYEDVQEDHEDHNYGLKVTGLFAVGGTVNDLEDGGILYRVHAFTNAGEDVLSIAFGNDTMEVLVVAGGGAGGSWCGGGGGGGGVLYEATYIVGMGNIPVSVGAGGIGVAAGVYPGTPTAGGSSSFGALTAVGGGAGGTFESPGGTGGSGGGATYQQTKGLGTAGQGHDGGVGSTSSPNYGGGGGGGAGAACSNGWATFAGNGGVGSAYDISGTTVYYGGGGGGGVCNGGTRGLGGAGGGGNAGSAGVNGQDGQPNSGGGGGAAFSTTATGHSNNKSGNGGSGIVIVRYALGTAYSISGRVTNSVTGTGMDGVTLAFGEDYTTVTTNGGYYSRSVPEGWSGTVGLSYERGGVFAPTGRTYTHVEIDYAGQDYGISNYDVLLTGRISVAGGDYGVDGVSLSSSAFSILTTNGGYYSVLLPWEWSGLVTPSFEYGCTFDPPERLYTNVVSDVITQDYSISGYLREISGRVTFSGSDIGVDGVVLSFGNETTTTTNGGYYTVLVPASWSGFSELSYSGVGTFDPSSRFYDHNTVNTRNQNYALGDSIFFYVATLPGTPGVLTNYSIDTRHAQIPVEFIRYAGDVVVTQGMTFGSATADARMLMVRVEGDLTVEAGVVMTPAARKRGMALFVQGNTVVNGTLSMTARGAANVAGQRLFVLPGDGAGYEIPAAGGAGGTSVSRSNRFSQGNAGSGGSNGGTGGGGSGAIDNTNRVMRSSGSGSAGTSYSGGSGGGGARHANGGNASINGGTGGWGTGGGGAGNPGGSGTPSGQDGTGGLLILYVGGNLEVGTGGSIRAQGSNGGEGSGGAAAAGAVRSMCSTGMRIQTKGS
jgi:hypothetical protein